MILKIQNYRWSSYPFYLRPAQRPGWLSVQRTLGTLGLSDDLSGRTHYRQIMQKRVLELSENTVVRNEWISEHLHMGRVLKMSHFVKQVEDAESGILLELREKVKEQDTFATFKGMGI